MRFGRLKRDHRERQSQSDVPVLSASIVYRTCDRAKMMVTVYQDLASPCGFKQMLSQKHVEHGLATVARPQVRLAS